MLNLEDFTWIAEKPESNNKVGGVYELAGQKYLLKQMSLRETTQELVGSRVAKLIAGDSVPEVELVRDENGLVYTASKFIDNFITARDYEKQHNLPESCFPNGCTIGENGSINYFHTYLLKIIDPSVNILVEEMPNAEEIRLGMALVEHTDTIGANLGLRKTDDGKMLGAVVDFSYSLQNSEQLRLYRYNPEKMLLAIEKLSSIAFEKIEQILDNSFKELNELYPEHDKDLSAYKENFRNALLARYNYSISLKNRMELEKEAIELIIAHKRNDTAKCDQLLPRIKQGLSIISDDFKILLIEYAFEYSKQIDVVSETSMRSLMFELEDYSGNFKKDLFDKILPQITDKQQLDELLDLAIAYYKHKLTSALLKNADQQLLATVLNKAVNSGNAGMLNAIISKITNLESLNAALAYATQNYGERLNYIHSSETTIVNSLTARIAELKTQAIEPIIPNNPLKTTSEMMVIGTAEGYKSIMPYGQQSISPPTAAIDTKTHTDIGITGIKMPSPQAVRSIAENTFSQIALARVVGHMINKTIGSEPTNHRAKVVDKRLLSLENQFKALHDKRMAEYDKSPSDALLEEIKHLKQLQDKATDTIARLEKFNKLDRTGDQKALQSEANDIWKSYKKLEKAKKVINVKNIAAVHKIADNLKKIEQGNLTHPPIPANKPPTIER